jgi:hypothetical protein
VNGLRDDPRLADDVVLCVIGIGQSWMQGGNNDPTDTVVTGEPEHPGVVMELDTGRRPHPVEGARLVDLFERIASCERPLSGCADALERALLADIGRTHPLVMVTSARGGSTLKGGKIPDDGMMPGSYTYGWMLAQLGQAAHLVRAQGKRLVVISIIVAHGEADAGLALPGEEFARGWCAIRRSAEADIQRLTGQSEPIFLHTYQTAFSASAASRTRTGERPERMADIGWWQLRIGELDPLCRCVGPVYWASKAPDDRGHVTARSSRRIGIQFGRYVYDDVFGQARSPLRIGSARWIDATRLRIDYGRPIVVETDDTRIKVCDLGPGMGYEIVDSEGGANPAVTDVIWAEEQPGCIDLIMTGPVTMGGARLLVGYRPTGNGVGRDHGARTAVRTLAPLERDPQDGFVLHAWACVERLDVPRSPG